MTQRNLATAPAAERREPDEGEPARFGGWSDYGEWADHDFRERNPGDEPKSPAQRPVVVETVTLDYPITAPVEPDDFETRVSCRITSADPGAEDADLTLDLEDSSTLVRPYVRSGGQSDIGHDLSFETMIETAQPYATLPLREMSEDQRQISRTCATPHSVAEIAVAIEAPLGLACAILSDAIDKGYLRVRSEELPTVDGLPSLDLLRRVHAGLSRMV